MYLSPIVALAAVRSKSFGCYLFIVLCTYHYFGGFCVGLRFGMLTLCPSTPKESSNAYTFVLAFS